ncbi:MAG: rhodanese-like domain-containing protein [Bdellovibrionales bacterium]|nr:rhodanese-like domain-containing protein [Bdellovibrionales bacterium]
MNSLLTKKPLSVCTFYHYHPLPVEHLNTLKDVIQNKGIGLRGLILLSGEGINATLVGSLRHLKRYLQVLREETGIPIQARWQISHSWGFKKLRIKIKKELVASGKEELSPFSDNTHLNPVEWEMALSKNPVLLDIRNNYEVQVGKFKGALDLNLDQFKNFPEKLKKSKIPKDKKVLIYCTGGIRCEKALNEMKSQGFKQVQQLKGGVLNYLKEFPNSHFKGNLFVFDHRVTLDQKLKPSGKYKLCPHCGQAGDQSISCQHCRKECIVCTLCMDKDRVYQTCSKNCSYHYKNGHRYKAKRPALPSC